MQQQRTRFPADLDLLDSPLLSPSMPGSVVGPTPGSALAELIFNDPDSWGTDADTSDEVDEESNGMSDPMGWFVEEVERFGMDSAASSLTAFSVDGEEEREGWDRERGEFKELGEGGLVELKLRPSPESTVRGATSFVKGVRRRSVHPISLSAFFGSGDNSDGKDDKGRGDEDEVDVAKKFLESATTTTTGGQELPTPTPFLSGKGFPMTPMSAVFSAGTDASSSSSLATGGLMSPVPINSASATLSFLEWYGIYPDSPRLDSAGLRNSLYALKGHLKPKLQIPAASAASMGPVGGLRESMLASPSMLIPDLGVEHPKRGSGVPPLGEMKPILEKIVGQATAVVVGVKEESEEEESAEVVGEEPAVPPGLGMLSEPVSAAVSLPASVVAAPVVPLPIPPSTRTPSPKISSTTETIINSTNPSPESTTSVVTTTASTTIPAPSVTAQKIPSREPSIQALRQRLPEENVPPPYTRKPSTTTTITTTPRALPTSIMAPPPPPPTVAAAATASTSEYRPSSPFVGTPSIRRLPSIPPTSGRSSTPPTTRHQNPNIAAATTTTTTTAPKGVFSPLPLPSSLPSSMLSPEPATMTPGGTQTIVFHGKPMSAVRSPMGPRSKAGRSVVAGGLRAGSGLVRRPPGLQL